MTRDPLLYLDDIKESIEQIEEYTESLSEKSFAKNKLALDAVLRRLQIIGEASKSLPAETKKKHPTVPWKKIIGLRNVVAHEYFDIRLDLIWKIIRKDLPELKKHVQKILQKQS